MLQFHKRIVSDKANDGYSRGRSIRFFLESLSVFKPPRFDLSDLRKHLFRADRTM